MKIIKHGVYYENSVKLNCLDCNCKFEIEESDLLKYAKPKKYTKCAWGDTWKETYTHYVRCPECNFENPIESRELMILTTKVKK